MGLIFQMGLLLFLVQSDGPARRLSADASRDWCRYRACQLIIGEGAFLNVTLTELPLSIAIGSIAYHFDLGRDFSPSINNIIFESSSILSWLSA